MSHLLVISLDHTSSQCVQDMVASTHASASLLLLNLFCPLPCLLFSPQIEEPLGERRYKDTRSERPMCLGVPRRPPVALNEGLHTNGHTCHLEQRCESLHSVRCIVYNRFTYPWAECDPYITHGSLSFSLTVFYKHTQTVFLVHCVDTDWHSRVYITIKLNFIPKWKSIQTAECPHKWNIHD